MDGGRISSWEVAVNPTLPASPAGSDGTEATMGEKQPPAPAICQVSEPRRSPAASQAAQLPPGTAKGEEYGWRQARGGSPGSPSRHLARNPEADAGCAAQQGLRFRVGPRRSLRFACRRSAPPRRSGLERAVAARQLPGPHG